MKGITGVSIDSSMMNGQGSKWWLLWVVGIIKGPEFRKGSDPSGLRALEEDLALGPEGWVDLFSKESERPYGQVAWHNGRLHVEKE